MTHADTESALGASRFLADCEIYLLSATERAYLSVAFVELE